jgi:hypothetical protein
VRVRERIVRVSRIQRGVLGRAELSELVSRDDIRERRFEREQVCERARARLLPETLAGACVERFQDDLHVPAILGVASSQQVPGIELFAQRACLQNALRRYLGPQLRRTHILPQRGRTHLAKPSYEPVAQTCERGIWLVPGRDLRELQDGEVPLGNVGRAGGRDSGEYPRSLADLDAPNGRRNERILCAR